jgi:hypothetical protein
MLQGWLMCCLRPAATPSAHPAPGGAGTGTPRCWRQAAAPPAGVAAWSSAVVASGCMMHCMPSQGGADGSLWHNERDFQVAVYKAAA